MFLKLTASKKGKIFFFKSFRIKILNSNLQKLKSSPFLYPLQSKSIKIFKKKTWEKKTTGLQKI